MLLGGFRLAKNGSEITYCSSQQQTSKTASGDEQGRNWERTKMEVGGVGWMLVLEMDMGKKGGGKRGVVA